MNNETRKKIMRRFCKIVLQGKVFLFSSEETYHNNEGASVETNHNNEACFLIIIQSYGDDPNSRSQLLLEAIEILNIYLRVLSAQAHFKH